MKLSAHVRHHVFGLTVLALVLLLAVIPLDRDTLALSREGLQRGEWWRILTSQLSHLSVAHALMNALGFIIISVSFREDFSPGHEALVLLTSMLAVSGGILLLNPEIHWYMGLSGAIYGLLTHHLLAGAPQQRGLAWLFLAGVVIKIVYEQSFAAPDRATERLIGGPVAVDAHLYGACWGIICGVISRKLSPGLTPPPVDPANGQLR